MASLNSVTQNELQQVVFQLEQAIYNHQQWHNSLIRTLICRLPGDNNDLLPDAHKHCRFGQWYYGDSLKEIKAHPGIINLGVSHQRMHQITAQLLQKASTPEGIAPLDYDHFANALEQMRLEFSTFKNELEYLLHSRDALTGALSRLNMLSTLREQQEFIKRQGQNCCLIMVDLDHFKEINDRYGHQTGDRVLATIARFLIENIRTYDKVFRYGGEEFLLCLPFTELDTGYAMSERLRKGLEAITIKDTERLIQVTASFGLALLDHQKPIEESIENADKALYLAKSEGRNCVRIWK
ncbi:diguanylate cyclase [Legionella tunisiensis]|uniref:diguanylate cyclase n=1 Tax=Legionella tunisiensis TaxID=1034944 RepID=UPI00031A4449|nr:diguanylate cyclase [Legionella tunisiensis]